MDLAVPTAVTGGASTVRLDVTGMTCTGCARRVSAALQAVPGVSAVDVNPALDRAEIAFDPLVATPRDCVGAVTTAGFGVREATTRLDVGGMTCAACADGVRRAVEDLSGVLDVDVNLALDRVDVRHVAGAWSVDVLIEAIEAAGYTAKVTGVAAGVVDGKAGQGQAREGRRDRLDLALATGLTLPLVAPMLLMPFGVQAHLPPWWELALATPVQFWVGRRFYVAAWQAIRRGAGNMDQLVVLGTTAAYVYSLALVAIAGAATTGHLYVEAAAVVITLVLVGKALEGRAKRSAASALRALMALRPDRARVLRAGHEVEVGIAEIAVGDVVVVRPGERVAVDGPIVRGESELDESLITGESLPVARRTGDRVVAGAINGSGLLRVRTERIGDDTTLARIGELVAHAQTGKAPIQRLVDRVSTVFVPAVLALAVVTFGGWLAIGGGFEMALVAAVAVLVVACPCALGLATPTALVAGTGAAARSGVLIRDIETLERAHDIDTVVLDKTGTLTMGTPSLRQTLPVESEDADELLRLVASAQRGSEHPLGKALVAAANSRSLALGEPEAFEATAGQGIEVEIDGRALRVGRPAFVAADVPPVVSAAAAAWEAEGATVVYAAAGDRLLGALALADVVRPDAAAAVARLHQRGVGTVLLTGDNARAAAWIADEVGIADVRADVPPEGKTAVIAELQAEGRRVAMVGDGVNDAPALAQADLGMAMGSGTDVARAAAGVTLMRPALTLVPAALDIAARTRAKIRQNLFWAFAYNVCALPVAALGLLSPAVAGAAMACSSVSVVASALLLKRWRPDVSASRP
ncbi:MAG: heavy metal translocating P-type ATPase [Pseudomonadota bacterium]